MYILIHNQDLFSLYRYSASLEGIQTLLYQMVSFSPINKLPKKTFAFSLFHIDFVFVI